MSDVMSSTSASHRSLLLDPMDGMSTPSPNISTLNLSELSERKSLETSCQQQVLGDLHNLRRNSMPAALYVSTSSSLSSSSQQRRNHLGHHTSSGSNNRRHRTTFTLQQLQLLEATFTSTQYPNSDLREQLSKAIGVSETRIQIWFQNKRAKSRRRSSSNPISNSLPATFGGDGTNNNSNAPTSGNRLPLLAAAAAVISPHVENSSSNNNNDVEMKPVLVPTTPETASSPASSSTPSVTLNNVNNDLLVQQLPLQDRIAYYSLALAASNRDFINRLLFSAGVDGGADGADVYLMLHNRPPWRPWESTSDPI